MCASKHRQHKFYDKRVYYGHENSSYVIFLHKVCKVFQPYLPRKQATEEQFRNRLHVIRIITKRRKYLSTRSFPIHPLSVLWSLRSSPQIAITIVIVRCTHFSSFARQMTLFENKRRYGDCSGGHKELAIYAIIHVSQNELYVRYVTLEVLVNEINQCVYFSTYKIEYHCFLNLVCQEAHCLTS